MLPPKGIFEKVVCQFPDADHKDDDWVTRGLGESDSWSSGSKSDRSSWFWEASCHGDLTMKPFRPRAKIDIAPTVVKRIMEIVGRRNFLRVSARLSVLRLA